ncbi:acyl-CoA dehydrogenase family protein [Dietzia sp.]|uniref:acyl-CoA dehydrogenase family protein n=1 Tax=Dietzia sp. TaxID=1871616 RepID=UPI002FDA71BC
MSDSGKTTDPAPEKDAKKPEHEGSEDKTVSSHETRLPEPKPELLLKALDGRWPDTRESVRESIKPEMLPALDIDRTAYRDKTLRDVKTLAAGGFSRGAFAEADGGTGETGPALTAFEMLGYVDLSTMVKAGVQWGLWGGAVSKLGSEETRAEFIPGTIDVSIPGCFAMTEIGGGSDVQSLATEATFDPDTQEFDVHCPTPAAQKAYIGGAGRDARFAAVFAQLVTGGPGEEKSSQGVHCFVVPIRDENGNDLPGVTTGDHGPKGGLPGVDNGTIVFDHVRIPKTNLLNRYGNVEEDGTYTSPIESAGRRFFTTLGALIRGRVSVGAASGAAARVAVALGTRYGLRRRQFDNPSTGEPALLLDYREHQRRIMPHVARAYAYAIAQNAILSELHDFESTPDIFDEIQRRQLETHAAGIKATVSGWANEAVSEMRLACGGAGYMAENRLTGIRADLDVFSTFEGDNVVLTQLVAKEQLTAYGHEFSDLDPVELVGKVISSAGDMVQERVRASTLWQRLIDSVTDRENTDLLERGHQIRLLTDREEHLLETAAQRLRKANSDDKVSAFDTFNRAQDHILEVGRAHMDLFVFDRFVEVIDEIKEEDPDTAEILDALCDLYFLDIVDKNKAWFLEHNRLTTERTKAATASYNRLCRSLSHYAGTLVDAFGIPEIILDVPMLREAGVDPLAGEADTAGFKPTFS